MPTPESKKDDFVTKDTLADTIREVMRSEEAAKAEKLKEDQLKQEEEQKQVEARRAEITEAVTAAVKPLQDEIAALKGTTVVRSEKGNEQQVDKGEEGRDVQRSESVFTGLFGNLQNLPSTDELESAAAAE